MKNVFQDIQKETKNNTLFFPVLLIIATIPLPFAINNLAIAFAILTALLGLKKENIQFQTILVLPIALYVLMVGSLVWTIDTQKTLASLSKELPFLIFPLLFIISKPFTYAQVQKLVGYFSRAMVLYAIYYMLRAIVRYAINGDTRAFFYHGEDHDDFGLVPKLLNAIHVSIYFSIAFFYFFRKQSKTILDYLIIALFLVMIFLLSSKNIIVVFTGLLVSHVLFLTKISKRMRMRNLIVFILFLSSFAFVDKIRERFIVEYETNMADSTVNDVISKGNDIVYNVSIRQAWNNTTFKPNDYFPGTAFRVYQFRIFLELMAENNAYWTGFGQDASYAKIKEKAIQYNLYLGDKKNNFDGYQNFNFHNQYTQIFADVGVVGFMLLLLMIGLNVLNGVKNKDFLHITFAVLMISLFLTESFLLRQRGIVFFTMLFCLFNHVPKQAKNY